MPSLKKILIAVFIIILLIAIPITIYLVSLQKSKAVETPTTTLTFVPVTQSVNAGDNLSLDISMDPGKNSVSTVSLLIAYDATKLATEEGGFVPNSSAFPSVVKGPTYDNGTIAVTLSVGANAPTIQTTTKVATINFKALEATDTAPTQITFDTQTNVLSANGTTQNVLSSASPATVNIAASQETPTPFPTASQIITPTPIVDSTNQDLTLNTTTTKTGPVCISFMADRPTTGTVPFNVNFTLIATDSAAIISKATFDFGDGQTQDITSANGLGDSPTTVNSLVLHVYNTNGTFTAKGSITDVDGNVSDSGTCSIVVNVGTETSTQTAELTPVPSPLPPTGNNSFTTILAFGLILILAGAILLFTL